MAKLLAEGVDQDLAKILDRKDQEISDVAASAQTLAERGLDDIAKIQSEVESMKNYEA